MEFIIAMLVIVFYLFLFAISIGMYLLNGFGLMALAKRSEEKYPFLGFIPYASLYLTGKLAYGSNKGGVFYLVSQIAIAVICNFISIVLVIASEIMKLEQDYIYIITAIIFIISILAVLIIQYVTLYRLYRKYSDKYVAMLLGTIFTFGMLSPIFIFAIRKNKILRN